MRISGSAMIWFLAVLAASPAGAWDLALPDTVQVNGTTAHLTDVARGPVPAAAGDMVVHAGGRPGTSVTVSRQTLLRRLVARGLAGGVRFRGAGECVLVFAGGQVAGGELGEAVRAALQVLVPPSYPGAPDSWFELELPDSELAAAAGWTVRCLRSEPLAPGRNPVRCELVDDRRRTAFSVTAILHRYGEVAAARVPVGRDQVLLPEHFRWEWRDLAGVRGRPVVGRGSLGGTSAARSLAPGDLLLAQDLKATPVVRRGDAVELWLMRGGLAVRVTARARQEGCVGQIIPVRNELTGQLVNARVAAPGVVEWRN